MKLLLPKPIATQLLEALAQAGQREIGGILMGEHVGADTFRVKDLTIQKRGGTFASFVRIVAEIIGPLRSFFKATNNNYTKYNYMGEWHSHHSFQLSPSGQDNNTMLEIISDPKVGANFIILVLVKLNEIEKLEGAVVVYQTNKRAYAGEFVLEDQ